MFVVPPPPADVRVPAYEDPSKAVPKLACVFEAKIKLPEPKRDPFKFKSWFLLTPETVSGSFKVKELENVTLAKPDVSSPPLLSLKVSVASSEESKTTGRLKIKLDDFLLFWIGWVTPTPVIVRVALLVAVIVTESAEPEPAILICATVLLLSTIRSALIVILAVLSVGIPADQLAALDQRLSPPVLLKVEIKTEAVDSWPEELITGVDPLSNTRANWFSVKPLASVPKEISLFPAPVITRDPVPQSEDELSAKASEVNDSGTVKVKVPLPIAIVPADDWFLLIVKLGL